MSSTNALPRWDLEIVFPSLESPEYKTEFNGIVEGLEALQSQFDQWGVDKGGPATDSVLKDVINQFNAITDRLWTLATYVGCTVTTDTRDEAALAAESELDTVLSLARKLSKRLSGWLGGLDIDAACAVSETVQAHRYSLERAKTEAAHLLSPELEELVSDMELTGGVAWAKLYNNVSSQISVEIDLEGTTQTLPISAVRALASDPDRAVRAKAYEAELAAWKANEVPIAAALNGCKGETILLAQRRGWASPLEMACFSAAIDVPTLEAMLLAAREYFPVFGRYMRAKAKALGLESLAFYDLFAPLPYGSREWSYTDAEKFVSDNFATFSNNLSAFAQRSYQERWLDYEPREGKVDGAYCAPLRRDESRILLNFKGTYDSVRTLAHELGHAYHNVCLNGRTSLQKETPATLAETASIFCETIVKEGVLAVGTEEEKLVALEGALTGACQVVVDITSRFLFERSVFELRAKREGNAREFCQFMLDAQRATYGDGLNPDLLHPYMWAAKGHYYGPTFYNFPYMFGLLFGLGLYAVYRQEGESFKARYDDLLSSTGLADAATLGARFGLDIRTPDFWRASLGQIAKDVERFEAIIDSRTQTA